MLTFKLVLFSKSVRLARVYKVLYCASVEKKTIMLRHDKKGLLKQHLETQKSLFGEYFNAMTKK